MFWTNLIFCVFKSSLDQSITDFGKRSLSKGRRYEPQNGNLLYVFNQRKSLPIPIINKKIEGNIQNKLISKFNLFVSLSENLYPLIPGQFLVQLQNFWYSYKIFCKVTKFLVQLQKFWYSYKIFGTVTKCLV